MRRCKRDEPPPNTGYLPWKNRSRGNAQQGKSNSYLRLWGPRPPTLVRGSGSNRSRSRGSPPHRWRAKGSWQQQPAPTWRPPAPAVSPWVSFPDAKEKLGYQPKSGYPNLWVEIPIYTHLEGKEGPLGRDSRNHINTLTAHGAIILPGGEGTLAEVNLFESLEKPMIFFGPEKEWKQMGQRQPRCADLEALRQWLQSVET